MPMEHIPKSLDKTADASRGRLDRPTVIKNTVSVFLFFFLAYWILGGLGILVSELIPDRWEVGLGASMFNLFEEDEEPPEELKTLEPLLKQFTKNESVRKLEYNLFLLEMDAPNALALPGGSIGITPQLLEKVQSEQGRAFILAHELGHHQHRHNLRRMGRGIFLALFSALLGNAGDLSSIETAYGLGNMAFSRGQEEEADTYALQQVHKHFGNTDKALEFFHVIQEEQEEALWEKYTGSHPLTQDRIDRLEALAASL